MRYQSKPTEPTEVEAMRWVSGNDNEDLTAVRLVRWVNANGGEARYLALPDGTGQGSTDHPRIAVRTINGWAYASPGHYVVMGTTTVSVRVPCGYYELFEPPKWRDVLDFYPVNAETFEKSWNPAQESF